MKNKLQGVKFMISWMQKHKKWLIITIWISTIAFIGAGFVGWGAYSYGKKASSIAKVGDIEVKFSQFQDAYSKLYNQYAKLFQGNFDQEKAKMFGLEKQAMQQVIQEALILNFAKEYDISVSDEELSSYITSMDVFKVNGKFDKSVYKETLSRNNLKVKEFEDSMRRSLIIQKTLKLLPVKASKNEENIMNTVFSIADKIEYKLINSDDIKVSVNEKDLKKFWEGIKDKFKTPIIYQIEYIKQMPVSKTYDEKTIKQYYLDNKTHFRGDDGKLLSFEYAKEKVIGELNAKATKKEALKKYISYKKGKIKTEEKVSLSSKSNPFNQEIFSKVQKASSNSTLKPIKFKDGYIIIKVVSIVPAKIKTFENAKAEVTPLYIAQKKQDLLIKKAQKLQNGFKGYVSDFVTYSDASKLKALQKEKASKFLAELFTKQTKKGYVVIDNDDIVLYNILEQKLLTNKNKESNSIITEMKKSLFNQNLIKNLQNRYKTEIYYKGL